MTNPTPPIVIQEQLLGWQPIESAPLVDDVLLYDGWIILIGWRHSAGYFVNHQCERLTEQPTHWMPLPEPPARGSISDVDDGR